MIGLEIISQAIRYPWVTIPLCFVVLACLSFVLYPNATKFVFHAFLKPLPGNSTSQITALEAFYAKQAEIYDVTRDKLLQGRQVMLALIASHIDFKNSGKIWVDVGGGTGWNIEQMNEIIPISQFKAVYLVDLSPSLLEIARRRFERLNFTNVFVVYGDASSFVIPDVPKADIITLSYSLSMIPTYYSALDHLERLLQDDGIVGVIDFYTSSSNVKHRTNLGSVQSRHVPLISRIFWRTWFEFDRVFLDADRRDYLEYRFGTIKSLNCRNKLLGWIPYHISIMCKKDRNQLKIEEVDASYTESPYFGPSLPNGGDTQVSNVVSKGFEAAIHNLQSNLPMPSFLYARKHWRVYYEETLAKHMQFTTYLYAFVWEDPKEDRRFLKIKPDDVMFCITSAGDNALDYALAGPRRIHCVDLNPTQNHLMELKLASFSCLEYNDIWKMFGEGVHPEFKTLLVEKLSPYLSSHAFQYWYANQDTFTKKGLYETGHSRLAIKCARWLFRICGISKEVKEMCSATTLVEQVSIWERRVKPIILHPLVSKLLIANPAFLWKALGVPVNQLALVEQDYENMLEYVKDTFDPIIRKRLLKNDNYFYYLCLTGRYSKECHPSYLAPSSYKKLTSGVLDGVRVHTDTVLEVLQRMNGGVLNKAIIMDHLDWFKEGSKDCEDEIIALRKAMKPDGQVLFRSASKHPFYVAVFEKHGFECKPAQVRHHGEVIDRTNMYASTWLCRKKDEMSELVLPSSVIDVKEISVSSSVDARR